MIDFEKNFAKIRKKSKQFNKYRPSCDDAFL